MSNPIVFDGCFGWYHPGSSDLGVVLCGPHGYEELCVHRHWRELAQSLSEQDLPTLRFDYPGTGDSAGDDEMPQRVDAWISSIRNAISTLRRISGVDRVALVGLRMGAMLATAAAEQENDLAALVLLAPIGSGETCFRELRALALMRAPARHRHSAAVTKAGGLEAAGFIYTPETITDLRTLPLLRSDRAPAERILLLSRPNAAADKDFHTRLFATAVPVDEDVFQDYPLLLRNADLSVYPQHGFGRVVDWLSGLRGEARQHRPPMTRLTVLRLPDANEKPIFFSRRPDMFGMLCQPDSPARRPVLVFLNTGSNHHIGTSRMTVTMARQLARSGFASLRLDVGGVGDSDAPSGRQANHPDNPAVIADVSCALDWLKDRGYDDIILIGLCSGAKLALETTLRDDRVVGQILLNLQGFWKSADASTQYVSRRAYFRMARRASTWKRAVRGEIDIWGIAKAVISRSVEAAAHDIHEVWHRLQRKDGTRSANIARFQGLAARRVSTCFVYVEEDPGLDELEVVFGRGGQMLCAVPNISMKILHEGDHIFSWDCSRRQLLSDIQQILTTMVVPANTCPPSAAVVLDNIITVEP